MRPQDVAERAVALAGGNDLVVVVNESSQVNLRWAGNGLTTNGAVGGQEVDVVAFASKGKGIATATASGQVVDDDSLRRLVDRARAMAAAADAADDAADLVEGGASPAWDDEPGTTTSDQLVPLAGGLGDAFARAAGDGVEHFGYAEHDVTTTFLATTTGTRLRHEQVTGRAEFTVKSQARSRSAWFGTADTDFGQIDVADLDDELRRALAWQGRSVPVRPGRHPVLLAPSAAADLMIDLYWAADARTALDGHSVFSAPGGATRLGERLGTGITLSSDPADARPGMACAPFEVSAVSSDTSSVFDNGVPLGRTDWISDGVLTDLISTRHTAAEAGFAARPGMDNLSLAVAGGAGSLAEVVAGMDSGLVVTCVWYNRLVDPQTLLITGLTRDGVYVVERGEIVGTCGNFRFNESPVSMLGRIVRAGETTRTLAREMGDYFNRAAMPALLIDGFNLSTTSAAL